MNINFIPAWDQGVLKPLEKLEVHKKGLRHKAVSVFLISDYNVLIQKRASMKYHTPGLWANTCCTHPLWSEDPKECAHRRLKEELGIEVPELVYKNKIDYKADVGNGLIENENVDVFVGSIKEKDNLKILSLFYNLNFIASYIGYTQNIKNCCCNTCDIETSFLIHYVW